METFIFKSDSSCFKVFVERKAFRQGLSLKISPSGSVKVYTPKNLSQKNIFRFLHQHQSWIEENIKHSEVLKREYPEKKFEQGEVFLLLGKWYFLDIRKRLDQNERQTKKQSRSSSRVSLEEDKIVLYYFEKNPSKQEGTNQEMPSKQEVKKQLIKFYKNFSKNILNLRVEEFSKKIQLFPKKISFRRQKTMWGSCSSNGHISLNWKLICAPIDVLDYVVIHELVHLKYQDHSKEFWKLVESFCPNYKTLKKWLSKNSYEFDFLSKDSEIHNIFSKND